MSNEINTSRRILDYSVLVSVLALAFYIAFIPHQNYPFPVHIDEWVHMARSQAMIDAGSPGFIDPFREQMSGLSSNLEAGFHLFWGVFQRISGLSWVTIFRYFPSIVFMITVLSVYIMARREGFGGEAALFTCLIVTTVGILGPGFLVPIAMGLVFVPLSIFLAFNFRNVWSYLLIFVFASFLLTIHAPSAICLVIILAPYILLNMKGAFRHSLVLTLTLVIPFLIPFPWIFDLLLPTARELLSPQPLPAYITLPRIITTYGYVPVLFCLLGTMVLALRGSRKDYSLVLGLLAMLIMLAIFYTLHYGVSIVYERGLMFMMLMLGIVAGAGLMWIKNLALPDKLGGYTIAPLVRQNTGRVLCLALVAFILAVSIPARQSIPYYQMIDEADYEAFTWIRDNVSSGYERAILDPWKATAFIAITKKKVFSRIHTNPQPSDNEAYAFLQGSCVDTAFLREHGISIVYSRSPCHNPDLVEVRENVYLLKEAD